MSFGSIAPMLKMAPRPRPSSAPNLRSFKCARASETEMGLDSVSGQETFGEEMWPLKGLATQRKSKWTTHTIVAKHQSLTDQASIALIHCQPHGGSDNSLADSWDDDAAANVKVER